MYTVKMNTWFLETMYWHSFKLLYLLEPLKTFDTKLTTAEAVFEKVKDIG